MGNPGKFWENWSTQSIAGKLLSLGNSLSVNLVNRYDDPNQSVSSNFIILRIDALLAVVERT